MVIKNLRALVVLALGLVLVCEGLRDDPELVDVVLVVAGLNNNNTVEVETEKHNEIYLNSWAVSGAVV